MSNIIQRSTQWLTGHRLELAVVGLSAFLLFITALPYMLITIEAGQTGVLWRRFFGGTELDKRWGEGTALVFPWDKMALYDLRLRRVSATFDALSNNGLSVQISVYFRFRPLEEFVTRLHKFIGPDYLDVLLVPEMGAHVRKVISQYSPETLYSTGRDKIQKQILDSVREQLSVSDQETEQLVRNYIFVDDVLITSIILPEAVRSAIESKEQTKQLSMAYDYKLEIESKEKTRKRIEAEGIRDFQHTIADGISEKYLKWEGIRATLKLAQSNNSKVVVIGAGDHGMPLILGSEYAASVPAQEAATPPRLEERAEPQSESYAPTMSVPLSGTGGLVPETPPKAEIFSPTPTNLVVPPQTETSGR